jgi:transcriptional regulator with XRE-family HTH domain
VRTGADRDRPYLALGQYFAQLRMSQGLSQEELAQRSARTKHRFDRTYVARIENGESADSAAKFLVYAAMLHADPRTVLEIINATEQWISYIEDLPIEEYLTRAKKNTDQGNFSVASMYALAGLTKATLQHDKDWQARYLLTAAIVFHSRNQYGITKTLADDLFNSEAATPDVRARAAVMLANASIHLDRLFTARGALRAIDRVAPAIDPLLRGHLLATDGIVELVHGNGEVAEQSFRQALELFWKQNSFVEIARTSHRLAEIQLARGHVDEAHVLAQQASTFAGRSEHVSMTSWAHLTLGRTHMANGDREVSKEHLLQAERIARRLQDEEALLVMRAYLLEWAQRFEDRALSRIMRDHVQRALRQVRVLPYYRAAALRILQPAH